ncbi:hypothetical protein NF212_16075 [Parasalinivibrio latis]|uniref:hypothetical protein n=1 Tax=Parasalinivibrio latis TaxID=2952610 RepID=UPI0030E4ABDF
MKRETIQNLIGHLSSAACCIECMIPDEPDGIDYTASRQQIKYCRQAIAEAQRELAEEDA